MVPLPRNCAVVGDIVTITQGKPLQSDTVVMGMAHSGSDDSVYLLD